MEQIDSFIATFTASEWVYWAIFVLAIAEASALTSFFLSGTIGLVVVGVLIAQGLLDPFFSIAAVYVGTLIGDVSTFFLSSQLQKVRYIRSAIARFEPVREPLGKAPVRFILAGHFTPYLRAVLPVLAAGKVAASRFLLIEAFAALASSCAFIALGYFSANALSRIPIENALAGVSIIAAISLVALWVYTRKPFCPLKRQPSRRWFNLRRALFFYFWYLPWHPIRWLEIWLRGAPSRRLRRDLATAFPDIRPGDVFLIRLHTPAPWGRWAHTAMAIQAERFAHGFSKVVTDHSITCLPVRYAIAHLRPRCDVETAMAAADFARSKIGAPVSIAAGRHETNRFSCSSLVVFAFREAGIELVDPRIARVVPDDIFTSPEMKLMRIVATEQVSHLTHRYVFAARKGSDHA
jgi:membrane protein DedA with SNARE-associated domain